MQNNCLGTNIDVWQSFAKFVNKANIWRRSVPILLTNDPTPGNSTQIFLPEESISDGFAPLSGRKQEERWFVAAEATLFNMVLYYYSWK